MHHALAYSEALFLLPGSALIAALAVAPALPSGVEQPVERAPRRRIEAREAARSEALARGCS